MNPDTPPRPNPACLAAGVGVIVFCALAVLAIAAIGSAVTT